MGDELLNGTPQTRYALVVLLLCCLLVTGRPCAFGERLFRRGHRERAASVYGCGDLRPHTR